MKIVKVTLEYDNGMVHEYNKVEDALVRLDVVKHVDAIVAELRQAEARGNEYC